MNTFEDKHSLHDSFAIRLIDQVYNEQFRGLLKKQHIQITYISDSKFQQYIMQNQPRKISKTKQKNQTPKQPKQQLNSCRNQHKTAQPPPPPPPSTTTQRKELIYWIGQIYEKKKQKQQLLQIGRTTANQIYSLHRHVKQLEQYQKKMKKEIERMQAQIQKDLSIDFYGGDGDTVLEYTCFQDSEEKIGLGFGYGKFGMGVLEIGGEDFDEDVEGQVYIV